MPTNPHIIGVINGRPIFAIAGGDGSTEDESAPTNEWVEELANLADVTDPRLGELEAELVAFAESAAAERDTATLEQIVDAISQIRAEAARRIDEATEAQARVDELMADIVVEEPTETPPADDSAETPPAATPAVPDADPALIADATPPADAPPADDPFSRLRARRAPMPQPPADHAPQPSPTRSTITTMGDVPGHSAGSELDNSSPTALSAAFIEKAKSVMSSPGSYKVARIHGTYPEDRFLNGNVQEDTEKIYSVVAEEALVATGGICPPETPRYELPGIAVEDRPIKNALPSFRVTRGGVVFNRPPTLADVDAGVEVITEATWAADNPTPTKDCVVVDCTAEVSVKVSSIHKCIQVNNFNRIYYPEQFNRFWQLAGAVHSRKAEDTLWNRMCSLSKTVSAGQVAGAYRDVLENLLQAQAVYRSSNRTDPRLGLVFGAPAWLRDLMAADLLRQAPGDMTLVRALTIVDEGVRSTGVRPFWSLEAGGQDFDVQANGALQPWPSTVETLLFHEGAFIFLDGGALDLGTEIRDSVLNSTNDVQAFAETMEEVAFTGVESWCFTMDLCPDGSFAQGKTLSVCTSGS